MFETSLPGVFAIGDVRHGSVKRVASAVGAGAIVVALVHQYLAMQQLGRGSMGITAGSGSSTSGGSGRRRRWCGP